MDLDPTAVHAAIRWLHVAAMATAFGGAVTVLALAIRPAAGSANAVLAVATRYEWLFWAAAGVLVMTGIGNVAAFGVALQGPSTDWGATLTLKLGLVLLLMTLSLPRTLAVARISVSVDGDRRESIGALRNFYAATTAAFAAILALAVWLAHGAAG